MAADTNSAVCFSFSFSRKNCHDHVIVILITCHVVYMQLEFRRGKLNSVWERENGRRLLQVNSFPVFIFH